MKLLFTILAALCLAADAQAQTVKALVYNTTNGQVITETNALTFTNALAFSPSAAATTRTNLGLGPTNTLTLSGLWATNNIEVTKIIFSDQPTNQTRIQFEEPSQAKTVVRNLTGSTNTNEPYSGSFKFQDPDTSATYTATVSNGIILRIEEY